MKSLKPILSFFLLVLLSCCTGSHMRQGSASKIINIHDSSSIKSYDTFWAYVENFEKDIPERFLKNKDYRLFAEGMNYIYRQSFDSAESHFSSLFKNSEDSLTRSNSKKILVDMLFFKSKWEELILLDTNETAVESSENSLRLADAFSKVPPERIKFPKDNVNIPIFLSPTGCPIVEVKVNGQRHFFWLDTGANYSVLSSDIALESGIDALSSEKIKALTGTIIKVDVFPILIDSIKLGNYSVYNHPAIMVQDFDLKFKFFSGGGGITKIDGILGWKFIQNLDLTINFVNKSIEIAKPKKTGSTNPNMYWLGCPIIRIANDEGTELLFGLDLGAEKTTITSNIFNKVDFEKIYSRTKVQGSAGGWIYNNARMISGLTLNFDGELIRFEDIGTGYQLKRLFVKLDGIFGTDFMRLGKVRINCPDQIFSFKIVE